MLTKYVLTIGETEHVIPDECLKNWDEIAFSLKRTDYSGVMRSFSTEFVFVGEIKELLWDLYLTDGFKAEASVTVYTITNNHEWQAQFSAPLDFSSLEVEDGALSVNAIDNTLAALIKSKKGQKYEYTMDSFGFNYIRVTITRMELKSYCHWEFPRTEINYYPDQYGAVCLQLVENKSAIVSKAWLEPTSESNGDDGSAENSFFFTSHGYHATFSMKCQGTVRCYLDMSMYGETRGSSPHASYMRLMANTEAEGGGNNRTIIANLWNDDVTKEVIDGVTYNMLFGGSLDIVTGDTSFLPDGTRVGMIAIVGEYTNPDTTEYWENNHVYVWDGHSWLQDAPPQYFYKERELNFTIDVPGTDIYIGTYIGMVTTGKMLIDYGFSVHVDWNDPAQHTISPRGLSPLTLATRLVGSICPGASVTIDADEEGLIATTALVCGEEMRLIPTSKVYCTFDQFCDFMECVFGYTYAVIGNTVRFLPRSAVFVDTESKEIKSFRDLNYTVNDNLIYSQVQIGFAKKEYGEIDGRYEKNFLNYYDTGYDLTDKKFTLQSKFRADSYGIEFTARKSEGSTTDEKADEDVFIVHYDTPQGYNPRYEPEDNDVYNPSECVRRNAPYIAALGNGAAVTLAMTSSDGDNSLEDVEIAAGDNLFSAGELEFSTDDMEMPDDPNALVALESDGFRYTGFIYEAECRYGRVNGVDYKLIVKDITEL